MQQTRIPAPESLMAQATLELYDPRNGDVALKIEPIPDSDELARPKRFNSFAVYWIQEGSGTFSADLASYPFAAGSLLFFVPYQAIRLLPDAPVRGLVLQFHANFLCIETYHEEVGCNGVLFNDIYGVPSIALVPPNDKEIAELIGSLEREMQEEGLAHVELLLSYLKILLVKSTRLKLEQQPIDWRAGARLPVVLDELKQLIETNFRTLHTPADYAQRLHVAPKTLGKLVKTHLHKTLTELIRDRVLKQAKWDLLHTLKPVKQIAAELGFADELYFSRLFKRATGCAPTFFREYETAIRGGSNLSMSLRQSSIPGSSSPA
jgi:AraC family transcriptional regulator, transcriptional activator of pobA